MKLNWNAEMKTQDYSRVMNNMRSELEKVKNEELRNNYTNQNGVVILFLVQGKRMEDNQRNDIIRIANEINRDVYGGMICLIMYKKKDNECVVVYVLDINCSFVIHTFRCHCCRYVHEVSGVRF